MLNPPPPPPPNLLAAYGLAKVHEEHVMLEMRSYRNFSNPCFLKSGTTATNPQFVTPLKAIIPIQKISQSQIDE
jgi:hypothetical protein